MTDSMAPASRPRHGSPVRRRAGDGALAGSVVELLALRRRGVSRLRGSAAEPGVLRYGVAGVLPARIGALARKSPRRARYRRTCREGDARHAGVLARWRVVGDAVAGALLGYAFLHPLAMVIFAYLDPRLAHPAAGEHGAAGLRAVTHSFTFEMVPMGAVFALFTAVIASVSGHYRRALAGERDALARELERNEWLLLGLERQTTALHTQNARLERLEGTNRRHTQFMAHDLKGHVQVILGYSGALLEDPTIRENARAVDALERIRRQATRMSAALGDMLDFARLQEAPQLLVERVPVATLLQRAAEDVALPSHLGAVSIGERHRSCPDVAVDARLIGRVLVNLAANALKHNRRGTRVELDAAVDRERGEVIFTCADDGEGVLPEVRASLFAAFAAHGPASAADSTGLGLAFCKAAVEAHGGRIWCESAEGRGARFSFTIPLGGEEVHDDECDEGAHPSG